jgi:hypothetical protein
MINGQTGCLLAEACLTTDPTRKRTAGRWAKGSACCLMAIAAVVSVGCGNKLESSVSGRVLLGDEPLSGGIVVFHPQQVGGAMPATQIGQDGSYSVRTGGYDGLEPGEYVITVAAGTGQTRAPTSPEELRQQSNTPSRVPLSYSRPDSSSLKLTVEPGKQTFDIVITAEGQ